MLEMLFWIVVFFIKVIFFLIALVIAIPILFVLSGIVCLVTGIIVVFVTSYLAQHTNLMDRFEKWLEPKLDAFDKWCSQFKKRDPEDEDIED